ncbi:MAG: hypothetical protein HC904_06485 [Blastochloris sp.]|nr:hypothetical protein [Blastochloris sp.]
MAFIQRTLKQIAKRYSGNLAYFKKPHYWRTLRFRVFAGISVVALAIVVAVAISSRMESDERGGFFLSQLYNPGPISQSHADIAKDCSKCHQVPNAMMVVDVKASPVDQACMECHKNHELHQPNVPRSHSCSACHHEHMGSGPMKPVTDANCASCHAVQAVMTQSAELGKTLPPSAFDLTPRDGHIHFRAPRPAEGYTAVFRSFEEGHPEFQVHREKLKDPNTLKFNHKVHMSAENMPLVDGKKMDCASCHQVDASGAYMQPMSFEKNCQSCHSLQFDARNPDIHLPHGDVESVQSFLASLPLQYAEKARRLGIREEAELKAFVRIQLEALRQEVRSSTELSQSIFFSTESRSPTPRIQSMPDEGRARFAGCAYCHEVKGQTTGVPELTPPVIPDRWLSRSQFDHSKHAHMDCASCHQVENSVATSDILMPSQQSCLDCHSSKGGIVASCQTCHGYHAHSSVAALQPTGASQGSLRHMMLNGGVVTSDK